DIAGERLVSRVAVSTPRPGRSGLPKSDIRVVGGVCRACAMASGRNGDTRSRLVLTRVRVVDTEGVRRAAVVPPDPDLDIDLDDGEVALHLARTFNRGSVGDISVGDVVDVTVCC